MLTAKKRRDGLPRRAGGDRVNANPLKNSHTHTTDRNSKHKTHFIATISSLIHQIANDNRPHAVVRIFSDELTGLLDSGANVTVLGNGCEELIDKWGIESNNKRMTVCTADGTKLRSHGSITLPLEYNGKRKYIKAIIIPEISKQLILGMNFWQSFGIIPSVNVLTTEQASDITAKANLSESEKERLANLLKNYDFAKTNTISFTNLVEHRIEVGDSEPIMQKQYPVSPYVQNSMYEEIDRMLGLGIIERTICPRWLNPVIAVPKKNGKVRVCLDARKLNECTKKFSYNSRNTNEILSRLKGSKYLSTLDLSDAYYQIKIAEDCRDFTSFKVGTKGTFRYVRMAMGLCNSASTWCELIDRVIGCDLEPECFSYIDDFIIATDTFERHLEVIEIVLSRLNAANLTISAEKSFFCKESLDFLGYKITPEGIKVNEDKITSIVNLPRPTTVRKIRQFIGMVGWHDAFIKHYSTLLAPITDLLRNTKDAHAKPKWTAEAIKSFSDIKDALISAPVLALPDYSLPFDIHTDASNVGIGAMLTQCQNNKHRVIAYYSAKLTPTQQRYMTTEKECLAVIMAVEKFKIYVQGVHFTVYTDHASLLWLNRFKDSNGRLVRWALRLQQYDFTLKHRKGKEMQVPDTLSRMFEVETIDVDTFSSTTDKTYFDLIDKCLNNHVDAQSFEIRNDRLYRKYTKNGNRQYRLYVPTDRINCVLTECHDEPTAAHGGFFKTRHRARQFYYWPKMDDDIRTHVKNCRTCKECKGVNYNLTTPMGKRRPADQPWSIVALDFIGPLPRSKAGNKYILTIIDCFSKYTLIHPCREATATKLIETIENKVFLAFGVPAKIICDNGTQFRSKAFADLCKAYGAELWFTPAYYPRANPSEAQNKVIGTAIRCYIQADKHKEWDANITKIQCALNTNVHTATNESPHSILYGRPYAPTHRHNDVAVDGDNYMSRPLKNIHDAVRLQLNKAYESSKKQYNLRSHDISYEVGETVYRRNYKLSNKANDFTHKLAPKYIQAIIESKNGSVYHVRDIGASNTMIFQARDLKKC